MAKKTHADIMQKLSALKPSEPTKTRGKARRPAAKKMKAKKAAPPKSPQPGAPSPKDIPPLSLTAFCAPGDAVKICLGVYESWFQIIRNCNSVVADCNNMFMSNLTSLMNPGRWGRF
jgi:hypothetical protein